MTAVTQRMVSDEDLADLAESLNELLPKRVYRRIAREVIPDLERAFDRRAQVLRRQPPRRTRTSPTFVWSDDPVKNARGRAGFFARYPNGYTRTGKLAKAWETELRFVRGAATGELIASVVNEADGASYTYGAEPYGYQQVPGHVRTGWFNAERVVLPLIEETLVEYEEGVAAILDEELQKL